MPVSDTEYYQLRVAQERDRAQRATRSDVRRIHLELATHYAERLEEARALADRPLLRIVLPR